MTVTEAYCVLQNPSEHRGRLIEAARALQESVEHITIENRTHRLVRVH